MIPSAPQKPPFKERAFQYALCYAWIALLPIYAVSFYTSLVGLFLFMIFGSWGSWIALALLSFIAWQGTFYGLCRLIPRLYPLFYLPRGYHSKWFWNRPPLFFHTEAFKQAFKDTWLPYIAQQGHLSKLSRQDSSLFDNLPTLSTSGDDMSWRANPMNPAHPHYSTSSFESISHRHDTPWSS